MKSIALQQEGCQPREITVESKNGVYVLRIGDETHELSIAMAGHGHGVLRIGARVVPFAAAAVDKMIHIWMNGQTYQFEQVDLRSRGRKDAPAMAAVGDVTAPMPGTVLKVAVSVGDVVEAHQQVVLLESMKMEMTLSVSGKGRVTGVHCREGELVQMGAVLVSLEAVDDESA